MNLFSILLIAVGSVIEVLGALYFATNMGGDGYAMPVFIASIAAGSMLTMGGVGWHVLQKRL
ncbi:hypothetical protein [Blastopirellula marina]|uniref:Uncharacterized protein n=1 Tax=Blastopirellula marina TaxID=124 RepID=A0A2S8GAA1_9BACT|nr:hypothetical protein [Blastopirellula marina]PQO41386.1 hypothetical protein C5Y93_30175 [Blastopirellula marina]